MSMFLDMEWIKDIATIVVTGFFTILGVIIGAKVSAKEEMRKYRYDFLVEAYTELFSGYLLYIQKNDADSYRSLMATCEKAILTCSKHSERLIKTFIIEISKDNVNSVVVHRLIDELREEAKKELGQRQ